MIYKAEESLREAYKICDEQNDNGLRAEAKMTEATLFLHQSEPPSSGSVSRFLEARSLCNSVYGEFSSLMARIYKNLSVYFKGHDENIFAYECFRRTWLIRRQIWGPHHPVTKATGAELIAVYEQEARMFNDSLPDDDSDGPNSKDRNYLRRMHFLDKL